MIFSRRLHGIELLDIPRCPQAIRDGALDYLQYIVRFGNAYAPTIPLLSRELRSRGINSVVDLCSGGGGPWPDLRAELVKSGVAPDLRVTLTDLYPNLDSYARNAARDAMVVGESRSIDVEHDDIAMPGLRTSFSSFHHFPPETARKVLRKLANGGHGIFIAEVTERSARATLFMLLAPLLVWLATPRIRPFSWTRLFFTYIVPAIPFVVCFDGIVSCFRTYSPAELRELVTSASDLNYEWQVGQLSARGQLPVTYALGFPKAHEA